MAGNGGQSQHIAELLDVEDPFERQARVAVLTDEELLAVHRKLASPAVIDERWTPLIEAELQRRGLWRPN